MKARLAVAAVVYAAIVLSMWLPYAAGSGMGYETHLVVRSEREPWWVGFFWTDDPLRLLANSYWHISYLFSKLIGMDGGYLAFEICYAVLWWLSGIAVFLAVQKLLDFDPGPAYAAGAIAISHSVDSMTGWAGQGQFLILQITFLAAVYLLAVAMEKGHEGAAWGASALCAATLLQYESPLPLLVLAPVAMWVFRGWKNWRAAALWYAPILVYVVITARRYIFLQAPVYQTAVVRQNWGWGALLDWAWLTASSLRVEWPESHWSLGAAAMALFLLGVWKFRAVPRGPDWRALAVAFACLTAAFPVILLLADSRTVWRTMTFGAPWAAALLAGLAWKLGRFRWVAAGAIVFCGVCAAIPKTRGHREQWESHRAPLAAILQAYPDVPDGTLILLRNVPSNADPFADQQWFDSGIRLLYPRRRVAGYYVRGGAKFEGNAPGGAYWPLVTDRTASHVLELEFPVRGSGAGTADPRAARRFFSH